MSRLVLAALGAAALLVGSMPAALAVQVQAPLPLPTPNLPPLPVPVPTPPPVSLPPLPVPVPAPPAPLAPVLGQGQSGQQQSAPPASGGGAGSGAPAAQAGPGPAPAQSAFTPSAAERAELPDEAQRFALETQQYQLVQDQGSLDDPQTDYQALGAGGNQGGFAWPFALRYQPSITQPFGCTNVAGEPYSAACATHRFHTGVDFGVPTGTPIRASMAGIARTFASDSGYGNYVLLIHGDGWATLYAHLSRILVSDGQVVGPRQVIGESGSTGFSTGPHLHFEVRYGSQYVDGCTFLGC